MRGKAFGQQRHYLRRDGARDPRSLQTPAQIDLMPAAGICGKRLSRRAGTASLPTRMPASNGDDITGAVDAARGEEDS